jgi:broad specificity polyphosphatase/5'/3'-nucleotidase SurE
VRTIAKQKEPETKRVNVNIPTALHSQFKSSTASKGLEMTVVLLQFIESYVQKHGVVAPKQKGRRA